MAKKHQFFVLTDTYPADTRFGMPPTAWLEERGIEYILGNISNPTMTMHQIINQKQTGTLQTWIRDFESIFQEGGPGGEELKRLIDRDFHVIDSFIFRIKIASNDDAAQYKLCWGWVWDGREAHVF